VREEFLEYVNKMFPEFFEDNEDLEIMTREVNGRARGDIDKFIKDNCGEYDRPCLYFCRSAVDLD
jgi:hypothetical protein